MTLSEKSAYLKGLMEGMNLDTETNEGKLLSAMVNLMADMAQAVGYVEDVTTSMSEELDEIEEDLDGLYEYISDEEDDFDDETTWTTRTTSPRRMITTWTILPSMK